MIHPHRFVYLLNQIWVLWVCAQLDPHRPPQEQTSLCVCVVISVPGLGRCCPPVPPWLSGRTGNPGGVQPAPRAGTCDPSSWIPASHTSACGAPKGRSVRRCMNAGAFVCVRDGGAGRQRGGWIIPTKVPNCFAILILHVYIYYQFQTHPGKSLTYWYADTRAHMLIQAYCLEIHTSTINQDAWGQHSLCCQFECWVFMYCMCLTAQQNIR